MSVDKLYNGLYKQKYKPPCGVTCSWLVIVINSIVSRPIKNHQVQRNSKLPPGSFFHIKQQHSSWFLVLHMTDLGGDNFKLQTKIQVLLTEQRFRFKIINI